MRKAAVLVMSVVFAATPLFAQVKSAVNPRATQAQGVDAQIVSVDSSKHTLTIRGDKANTTLPVEGKALSSLSNLRPGEAVKLAYRNDGKGQHVAVTEVTAAAMAPTTMARK